MRQTVDTSQAQEWEAVVVEAQAHKVAQIQKHMDREQAGAVSVRATGSLQALHCQSVRRPRLMGGGGGSEAKNKFVHLKSTSNFGPVLMNFIFFPEENFSDVVGWVAGSGG